jgi:hypothetical protein
MAAARCFLLFPDDVIETWAAVVRHTRPLQRAGISLKLAMATKIDAPAS